MKTMILLESEERKLILYAKNKMKEFLKSLNLEYDLTRYFKNYIPDSNVKLKLQPSILINNRIFTHEIGLSQVTGNISIKPKISNDLLKKSNYILHNDINYVDYKKEYLLSYNGLADFYEISQIEIFNNKSKKTFNRDIYYLLKMFNIRNVEQIMIKDVIEYVNSFNSFNIFNYKLSDVELEFITTNGLKNNNFPFNPKIMNKLDWNLMLGHHDEISNMIPIYGSLRKVSSESKYQFSIKKGISLKQKSNIVEYTDFDLPKYDDLYSALQFLKYITLLSSDLLRKINSFEIILTPSQINEILNEVN